MRCLRSYSGQLRWTSTPDFRPLDTDVKAGQPTGLQSVPKDAVHEVVLSASPEAQSAFMRRRSCSGDLWIPVLAFQAQRRDIRIGQPTDFEGISTDFIDNMIPSGSPETQSAFVRRRSCSQGQTSQPLDLEGISKDHVDIMVLSASPAAQSAFMRRRCCFCARCNTEKSTLRTGFWRG